MKRLLVGLAIGALVVALLVGALTRNSGPSQPGSSAPAVSRFLPAPPLSPPHETVFYGYVKSLLPKGEGYELRVDPALFLGGLTASRAAVEDGAISAGDAVPNDYYVRDESHRPLTYVVPRGAHVTVVTQGPTATAIPVSELARIVAGQDTSTKPFEPRSGFWIRVATDTVRAMDQQYRP